MKTIAFPHLRLPLAALLLVLTACEPGSEPDDPPRPAAITISPESATLSSLGETATFTARITDQYGADFPGTATWSTSDATVFSVSSQGVVTANGNGSGTLTATFQSLSATASVVVRQVPVAIGVSPESATLSSLGETATFTATITDANGAEVPGTATWSSSDSGIFTVDADGVVTAVGNGSGTVTASFEDLTGTASVEVEQVPAAITISPDSVTLSSLGETATFNATITDANGSEVTSAATWSSSDPAVFTASSDGLVTAVGNGSGTLTASLDAVAATASVLVEQTPAALTIISGDAQEGLAGDPLAEPLIVRVDDAGGSPVEGVAVTFVPAEGHGTADPATAETDAEGLAQTTWTLGAEAGAHALTASLDDGTSLQFTASAQPRDPAGSAVYQVVFEAMWSDSTHPNSGFPAVPHFSPLIGAVHSDGITFWELGDSASPGMEDMAEKGGMMVLAAEITAEIPDNALAVVTADGLRSPGSRTIERVVVQPDYPLVTLVTMLGPSPDWFAGIAGQSLLDDAGEWIAELRIVLYPLDAGTDGGTEYTAANEDTSPKQPIRSAKGEYPFSEEPVGTFIFTRIDGSGGP